MDELISLAFNIQSNRGVFALLLGSGVSQSAHVLTGWQVMEDLIHRLAHMQEADYGNDAFAWYKQTYDVEPNYSTMLESLAHTPAERSAILSHYFEPDEDERAQGFKTPTAAHQAIAQLVARGYVRVIITTNFDTLLEQALEAAGVVPTVIRRADDIEAASPLIHTRCYVIKVHGDYRDIATKNTVEELSSYDARIDRVLDRVFEEFGLIVCGWSAEWDQALRNALTRSSSYRYSTYWTLRPPSKLAVRELIEVLHGTELIIKNADTFFQDLAERVFALETFGQRESLSIAAAVGMAKRYIVDDRERIRLRDLVFRETEKVYGELLGSEFDVANPMYSKEELVRRMQRYEDLVAVLQALLITGCYEGKSNHQRIWVECVQRIGNPPSPSSSLPSWRRLSAYPALILLYAGGIAAIAAQHYETLTALLLQPRRREYFQEKAMTPQLITWRTIDSNSQKTDIPGEENHHTPLSDHLHSVLRTSMSDYLPDDEDYDQCFDRFEYLQALVVAFLENGNTLPVGRFRWRNSDSPSQSVMSKIDAEIAKMGADWPPLKAGLFDGSLEELQTVKANALQWWGNHPIF